MKIKSIEKKSALEYDMEKDHIIYTDTDSIFFSMENLCKLKYPNIDVDDTKQMTKSILEITFDIQKYVNASMDYFAKKFLNLEYHRFNLKQEIIAKRGFWTTKKRYALWAINIEGRPVDELEVKGLDVVRTSFPTVFRNFMTQMLEDILKDKTKEEVDSTILKLKDKINEVDIPDIARPTSIKEISKFTDNTHQIFNYKRLGAPIHVKSAINYNDLLRHHGIENKVPYITDGEKIKWVYLIDGNPFRLETLAFRDIDEDPKEIVDYIKKYIDRDKIFEAELDKKVQDFYNALNWGKIITKVYVDSSKFF